MLKQKKRIRNKSVCFRMSNKELKKLEARITISNLNRSEFFIKMLLDGNISIRVGKYESDRLSLELLKLRLRLDDFKKDKNVVEFKQEIVDCITLIETLMYVINSDEEDNS